MKGKKILLLSLALLLPACIFIFLKIFGENQFDVPPLHQEKIDAPLNCTLTYSVPYALPDTIMEAIKSGSNAPLYIVDFSKIETNLTRVREQFSEEQVNITQVLSLRYNEKEQNFVKDCIVLLSAPATLALIDSQAGIRGYYNGSEREEIDRLIVELNIILKKY